MGNGRSKHTASGPVVIRTDEVELERHSGIQPAHPEMSFRPSAATFGADARKPAADSLSPRHSSDPKPARIQIAGWLRPSGFGAPASRRDLLA